MWNMLFQHLAGALWPNIFQHLQHASPARLQYIVNICLIVVLPPMHEKIRMTKGGKSATSVIGQAVVAPTHRKPSCPLTRRAGWRCAMLMFAGVCPRGQYIPTLSEVFV